MFYTYLKINISTFALLFAEMVRYAQNKVNTVQALQEKYGIFLKLKKIFHLTRLTDYGKFVGIRLLDIITLREVYSFYLNLKLL